MEYLQYSYQYGIGFSMSVDLFYEIQFYNMTKLCFILDNNVVCLPQPQRTWKRGGLCSAAPPHVSISEVPDIADAPLSTLKFLAQAPLSVVCWSPPSSNLSSPESSRTVLSSSYTCECLRPPPPWTRSEIPNMNTQH